MKKYKYEIHMHTAEGSACGKTYAKDYIAKFIELGYDGIIITDHFFRGNTAIDRKLPWAEFIEQYCKGYEEAKAEGDRQGLKVFFGWEECFRPDEYLVYGPDKEWLKAHPEILELNHKEYLEKIHEAGGCVIGAHPFRERGYVNNVNLHPWQCDAMEVANFGNPPYQDILAYNFCKDRGITMTSGTDLHDVRILTDTPCGMLFDEPLNSVEDFVKCIRSGKGFEPVIPDERRAQLTEDIVNTLPMVMYDRDNNGTAVEIKDIFPAK